MKKIIAFIAVSVFSLAFVFAQEQIEAGQPDFSEKTSGFSQIDKSLFFTLGPKLMVNTDDHTKSAPSPVMYSLGIGGDFTFTNGILLQAHSSFFTNYYLWDGNNAQPAEVENRTATALSAMIDLSGGYTFRLGESKNHFLSIAGGLGIFARYAILSNGVGEDEPNRETGSKAGDDLSNINDYFYSDLNFFYPQFSLSYSYALSEIWKIGGEARAYIPLGSLMNERGSDGMIVSLAFKLSYK